MNRKLYQQANELAGAIDDLNRQLGNLAFSDGMEKATAPAVLATCALAAGKLVNQAIDLREAIRKESLTDAQAVIHFYQEPQ